MKKRVLALILVAAMCMSLLAGCGGAPAASGGEEPAGNEPAAELSPVQAIIKEAQGMTMEELARKAIEESNGKTLYGVGNSSRGKSALPKFIDYLKTIDPSYDLQYEWQ